jgi:GxxExxY protein
MKMKYENLPEETERIAKQVVDAAYHVHKVLGPGLLEKIYEVCLYYELTKRHIKFKRQVNVPIKYDNMTFDEGYRLDMLVEDQIIIELKACDKYNPVWNAQVLSYLKVTGKRLGLIINFNVHLIKQGIKRVIL